MLDSPHWKVCTDFLFCHVRRQMDERKVANRPRFEALLNAYWDIDGVMNLYPRAVYEDRIDEFEEAIELCIKSKCTIPILQIYEDCIAK